MIRCAAVSALALLLALPVAAQVPRKFPATALRGELVITLPPEVRLNGQPGRLAPGARIRGADNMLQMSGALAGKKFAVHYTVDPGGQLLDVWVLTAAEFSRKPWPVTADEAAKWRFNADAQAWSKP